MFKRLILVSSMLLLAINNIGCKTELRDCNLLLSRTSPDHLLRCKDHDDIPVKGVAPWIIKCAEEHEK